MYGLVIESLVAEHFYSHLCETEKKHGGEYMYPRPKGLGSVWFSSNSDSYNWLSTQLLLIFFLFYFHIHLHVSIVFLNGRSKNINVCFFLFYFHFRVYVFVYFPQWYFSSKLREYVFWFFEERWWSSVGDLYVLFSFLSFSSCYLGISHFLFLLLFPVYDFFFDPPLNQLHFCISIMYVLFLFVLPAVEQVQLNIKCHVQYIFSFFISNLSRIAIFGNCPFDRKHKTEPCRRGREYPECKGKRKWPRDTENAYTHRLRVKEYMPLLFSHSLSLSSARVSSVMLILYSPS